MKIGGVENLSFFPVSEFPYMPIKFLLHSSLVKYDNEIGKISYVMSQADSPKECLSLFMDCVSLHLSLGYSE